jgi:hypothetical protein
LGQAGNLFFIKEGPTYTPINLDLVQQFINSLTYFLNPMLRDALIPAREN